MSKKTSFFLVLKFGKSFNGIQWSFLVHYSISDLLFQFFSANKKKNKMSKLLLKGGMTWIPVTLFLVLYYIIFIMLYCTILYIIPIHEWHIWVSTKHLGAKASLCFISSLFLAVLGTEPRTFFMLVKCSITELHPSSFFFEARLACVWGAPSALFSRSLCYFIFLIHLLAVLRRGLSFCNRLACLCLSPTPGLCKHSLRNIWEAAGRVGVLALKALKTTRCSGARL